MKRKNNITRVGDFRAFSLIELMISLIAISLITAAFAPVISKKLSSSEFTIGVGSGSAGNLTAGKISTKGDVEGCMIYQDNECVICNSEYVLDTDNNKCVKCENGQYLSGVECIDCPSGSICDGYEQQTCPEGRYCSGGSEVRNCNSGTWSEGSAKSQSDCTSCEKGYACNSGAKVPCPEGTYAISGSSICTNCEGGKWSSTTSSSCSINCPAGYKCRDGVKTECNSGTYAKEGSSDCTICSSLCMGCDIKTGECSECIKGYYVSNNKECISCPSGYYCEGGSSEPKSCRDECLTCENKDSCISCKIGYEYNNGSCNPCPEGSYCSGGTATAYECSSISEGCLSCSSTTQCNLCTNGYYLENGKCVECEIGYSCKDNTKTGCIAGTYTSEKKQSSCSDCEEGYYCPGSSNRKSCTAGTYNPDKKKSSINDCKKCAAGTYNPNTASTSSSACTTCPNGTGSAEGANSCTITCSENCTTCTSATSCINCKRGYNLSGTSCILDPIWKWFEAGGYYIAKYNVGDNNGPLGSSSALTGAGISVCGTAVSCPYGSDTPTCWQGSTSISTGNYYCTSYSSYSPCLRTVCNWYAGNKACRHLGYRLPTSAELYFWRNPIENWYDLQYHKLAQGLNLCGVADNDTLLENCDNNWGSYPYGGCNKAQSNVCSNHILWAYDGFANMYGPEYWPVNTMAEIQLDHTGTIRCVKD